MTGARAALLDPLIGGDPRLPRLVVYADDGRTELSGATLANWTAKVAGLLRDELGAAAGGLVAVLSAAGWQTAPILLGAWWCGLTVTDADDPAALAAFVPDGDDAAAEEIFVVSGHPLGAPSTRVAAHQRDFTGAVLPQADRLGSIADPDGAVTLVRAAGRDPGTGDAGSVAAVLDRVRRSAERLRATRSGSGSEDRSGGGSEGWSGSAAEGRSGGGSEGWSGSAAGGRSGGGSEGWSGSGDEGSAGSRRPVLLSVVDWTLPDGVAATLLTTLASGGTLVQCPAAWDPDRLAATAAAERATATLGVTLPGLPVLPLAAL